MSDLLATGQLPVETIDDVTGEWSPDVFVPEAQQPIIAAIQAGQMAMFQEYQDAATYAALQSDPLTATDEYLDEIAANEYGVPRQKNEKDEAYRAHLFSITTVSPNRIVAIANAILAPFTAISARYFEHLDGLFLGAYYAPGDVRNTTWSSHLYLASEPNSVPNYPDRLYDEIPNRRPGGARVFLGPQGRVFVLRVPDIAGIDGSVSAAVYNWDASFLAIFNAPPTAGLFLGKVPLEGPLAVFSPGVTLDNTHTIANCRTDLGGGAIFITMPPAPTDGMMVAVVDSGNNCNINPVLIYASPGQTIQDPSNPTLSPPGTTATLAGNGSSAFWKWIAGLSRWALDGGAATYLYNIGTTSSDAYNEIVSAVNAVRGQSVRWTMEVDPRLLA